MLLFVLTQSKNWTEKCQKNTFDFSLLSLDFESKQSTSGLYLQFVFKVKIMNIPTTRHSLCKYYNSLKKGKKQETFLFLFVVKCHTLG